jgi:hypothetical protein
VQGLDIYPNYRYDLEAREDGNFDLDFRARELNGFGENKWEALLSAFRGLPYATVYVDYYNLAHSATNATAMLRWDDQKRRANLRFSGPLQSNPKYRWQLGADVRSELWALRPSFSAPPFGALNLRRQAAAGSLTAFVSGRFIWSLAAEISHRSFENAVVPNLLTPFRVNAYEIKQTASLKYLAWRMPEYRWSVSTGVSAESGALLGSAKNGFEKLQASAEWHWQPQMAGDDYAVREQVRVGKTFGEIPFDELFMLGLERDNDLWLRAHIGTRSGAKGSAPLGRNYFLSNGEIDKSVYTNGFLGVKLSPFLDIGKITDAVKVLGSHEWLVDAGVQLKFSLLGVGVTFTYGKDLRTGNNAFYATTER